MHEVDILLSTYNGAKYLSEQLNSITQQEFENWRLIARDDGSNDSTDELLREFKNKFNPNKIVLLSNDANKNLGPSSSYATILEKSSAPYIMFSDQDDVWTKNKISILLEHIKKLECQYGCNSPVLIFSDMKVVDNSLNVISNSFFQHNKLPTSYELPQLFFFNNIPACSMMFNRALLDYASPIPRECVMHDWWLNLCVQINGISSFVPERLLLYRQHDDNYYGAGKLNILKYMRFKEYHLNLKQNISQLNIFNQRYGSEIDDKEYFLSLNELSRLYEYNYFKRKMTIIKYSGPSCSFMKKLAMFILS